MVRPATGVTHHPRSPRIFISAGEPSGDIVAARLIAALRATDASVCVTGIGGSHMAGAGATVIASADHLGVIGVSEAVGTAPSAVRIFRTAIRHCRTHRPDVAVLIANDIFHVLLGRRLRAHGIRTISLFPPQTWIWGAIARFIASSFDHVLASFPEEADCYTRAGVPTTFVGHYLADVLPPRTLKDRGDARHSLGLPAEAPVVAILPGSRRLEITRLLPELLATADLILREEPGVHVVAVLNTAGTTGGTMHTPAGHQIRILSESHTVMHAADLLVVCSGTATLEAALIGTPMVVAYRTSWITYKIVRAAIGLGLMPGDTVALPNLLLNRRAVPEFIQDQLSPSALAQSVLALFRGPDDRSVMRDDLRKVRAQVEGPDTLVRAARIILGRSAV